MKYTEILEELKKRGASKILPFTPFADWHEDFSDNGFVVLPDSLPVDYLDPINRHKTYWGVNLRRLRLD